MCFGGSKSKKKTFPTVTAEPNPAAVADTSNENHAQQAVVATTADQSTPPSSFGAELGGN